MVKKEKESFVYAVDGVNFDIYPGETLGLVGESGCGKSTLGRTIMNLHQKTDGEILFNDKDVSTMNAKELSEFRKQVQIIFQNPYASLNPRKTVYEILKIAVEASGVKNKRDREVEIRNLIERVGLSERHLDQYPHQFSGGQRQRIGIARALAMKPSFIVADEPVSALDVSVQAQILNLLEDLKEELNLTYLFIAHDLSVVYHVSDRVAVMYLGQVVELAETKELFENPKHPYSKALLSSIPNIDSTNKRERILLEGTVPTPMDKHEGCVFKSRCFMKMGEICDKVRPKMTNVNGHQVACHLFNEEEVNEETDHRHQLQL
jgi:oligopeptide/dipeptide ABC transporter ATP-binding protein